MKKPTKAKAPAKKVTEAKAPVIEMSDEKATTSTAKAVTSEVKKGRVEVVVTAKKFGTYTKGDVVPMDASTAKGCVAHGVVEYK